MADEQPPRLNAHQIATLDAALAALLQNAPEAAQARARASAALEAMAAEALGAFAVLAEAAARLDGAAARGARFVELEPNARAALLAELLAAGPPTAEASWLGTRWPGLLRRTVLAVTLTGAASSALGFPGASWQTGGHPDSHLPPRAAGATATAEGATA